jgi:hypothetical protein
MPTFFRRFALAASVLFLAAAAPAAEPKTALDQLPADTEMVFSVLRLGETLERFGQTNLWKMIREDKFAQEAWKQLVAKYEAGEGEWGMIKAILADPANKDWPALAADLGSHEIFVAAGAGSADLYAAYQEAFGYEGLWQSFMEGVKNPNGNQANDAVKKRYRALLLSYNAKPDRLKVPNILLGFKVTDEKKLARQLDRLDDFLPTVLKGSKLEGRVAKEKVAGGEFRVLTLDREIVPWNDLEEALEEFEEKPNEFKDLVAHLKKRTLKVALGVRNGYLLVAFGETLDQLGRFGGAGDTLAARKEFQPLAKHADKPITSVGYASAKFRQAATPNATVVPGIVEILREALKRSEELPEDQRKAIEKDLETLAKDLANGVKPLQAEMAFSFRSAGGWESYSHDYTPTDGVSKTPLTMLNQLDGNPLFAAVYRSRTTVEDYKNLVKWLGIFAGHAETFARTNAPNGEEMVKSYREQALPLLKELDTIIGTLWFPAVADGQAGLVVDGKWTSKQWHAAMPATEQPMPMFEFGLMLGVSDAAKFEKAVEGLRLWVNKAYAKGRDLNPAGDAPEFELKKPPVIKVKGISLATLALPDGSGLDEQVVPTAGLSEKFAALALSRAHTERLLKETPFKGGSGPLGDPKKPLDSAVYANPAGLVDVLAPWLEMAAGFAPVPDDGPNPAEYLPKVLAVLKVVKGYSSATWRDATGTVTHSETLLGDIPAAKK